MKILIACEESQATTIELRKLGFDAWLSAQAMAIQWGNFLMERKRSICA